jgi:predicted nucleotidyltransferase
MREGREGQEVAEDATIGGWTRDELAAAAASAVGDEGSSDFYAVAGSRIYGFASEGSDVDLRGFHVADGVRYLLLDPPVQRIAIEPGTDAEAIPRGERADLDLVSYELRTFGTLLAEANFNVLELVFDGLVVRDEHAAEMDALRALVRDALPLDVPNRYMGMARHNYERCRRGSADVKHYLYALRGALAAHYVDERADIEADVVALSEAVLGDTELVDELVAAKRRPAERSLDDDLAGRALRLVDGLLDAELVEASVETAEYRRGIDEWMLRVRGLERERNSAGRV